MQIGNQNFIRTFPNRSDRTNYYRRKFKLSPTTIIDATMIIIFVWMEKLGSKCENERKIRWEWCSHKMKSRKQILSLACKCIEHKLSRIFFIVFKCVVMWCCPQAFYVSSFSFYTLHSMEIIVCPRRFQTQQRNLSA